MFLISAILQLPRRITFTSSSALGKHCTSHVTIVSTDLNTCISIIVLYSISQMSTAVHCLISYVIVSTVHFVTSGYNDVCLIINRRTQVLVPMPRSTKKHKTIAMATECMKMGLRGTFLLKTQAVNLQLDRYNNERNQYDKFVSVILIISFQVWM